MTVFFTADTHFGHANIIRYCRRPFASVDEMDQCLIENWNARVGADDEVWHIGDFCSHRDGQCDAIWWRLAGRKHLVVGNHDLENSRVLDLPWAEKPEKFVEISCENQVVFLCHYAMRCWPRIGKGAIHLFGHAHGRLAGTTQSIDVGADCWDFRPVTLPEIVARLKKQARPPESLGRTEAREQQSLDALTERFDEYLESLKDPQTGERIDRVFKAKGRLRQRPKAGRSGTRPTKGDPGEDR